MVGKELYSCQFVYIKQRDNFIHSGSGTCKRGTNSINNRLINYEIILFIAEAVHVNAVQIQLTTD